MDTARLMEAPVAVALHRYVEAAIPSIRLWPVEIRHLNSGDDDLDIRRRAVRARLDAFVDRAIAEGFFRADLPKDWIRALLDRTVHLAAHQVPDLTAPQCTDLVVATLLKGIGGPAV